MTTSRILLCVLFPAALGVQTNSQIPLSDTVWKIEQATYLTGLPEVKPHTRGALTLNRHSVVFATGDVEAAIPVAQITAVATGDERIETGGTTGKIARQIIPFGGGSALGAVTNKSVDLFTIEFQDLYGGFHGAVFVLPKEQAARLQSRLAVEMTRHAPESPPSCDAPRGGPTGMVLLPIQVTGVELPAEYRVLLYEQLFEELAKSRGMETLYRAGDLSSGPGCAALSLHIEVTGFKNGNQALRASTGPAGYFFGTTSLNFHVKLAAPGHKLLIDKDFKQSQHGDNDSLTVVHDLARSVTKRLKKATDDTDAQSSTAPRKA